MAAGDAFQGKRHDLTEWSWAEGDGPQSGEYGKQPDGRWYGIAPDGQMSMANFNAHTVVEHEDGTITVSPSILLTRGEGKSWHGYLERGIWSEV